MKTKHLPYSLYKKKVGGRRIWYARFWNPKTRRYDAHRSTGVEAAGLKERRGEAEIIAAGLLSSLPFNVSYQSLIGFLRAFWNTDSPYFKTKELVNKKKLSAYYARASQSLIKNHIALFEPFKAASVSGLSTSLIKDFMLWEARRGVSGNRINRALQVLRVPVRAEIDNGNLETDPFMRVRPAAESPQKKGVLTKVEALRLINSPVKNVTRRLAVLLGLLAGLRQGEVRGLCWEDADFQNGVIHVRRNWQNLEGSKPPKCDSSRDIPMVGALRDVFESARLVSGAADCGLVFRKHGGDKPYCVSFFRNAFNFELAALGIDDDMRVERNLTFHSLRHSFVSLSRLGGLNDFQIMGLAGHKSSAMMDRYSHPAEVLVSEDCRETLEKSLKRA